MRQTQTYPYYSGSGLGEATAQTSTWWTDWGPVIVQIIGSSLVSIGGQWQTNVSNKKITDAINKNTPGASTAGPPTEADVDKMAAQMVRMNSGLTLQQAKDFLKNKVGGGVPPPSALPSWALPVGIGLVLFVLLKGKGGA